MPQGSARPAASQSMATSLGLIPLIVLGCGLACRPVPPAAGPGALGESAGERPENPMKAMRWRRLSLLDEKGQILAGAPLRAARQRRENLDYWADPAAGANITPGDWVSRGPQNVGGRTRALLVHPTTPGLLWAGSASGGIWRTADGGITWTPVNDFLGNLAVGSMAMDPGNPNVLYAGTGEGVFNADAIRGAGIFKSIDGGVTWNQLPTTANWESVNRIAISPVNSNVLLAAVRYGGIYRSTNGGTSWTLVRSAQGSFDLDFHPMDGTKAVAHIIDYDFGVNDWFHLAEYSVDGGVTWQTSTGGLSRVNSFYGRIELTYAPSSPTTVYANCERDGGKIWKSIDGGQSYIQVTTSGVTGGSWYNNVLWIDPTNPGFLVAGGTPLYKSTDGGVTLSMITDGYILTQNPHPDHHGIFAAPGFDGTTNKRVYVTNDGGVFRTDDIYSASTTSGWMSLVQTYQTSQYFGAAGHSSGLIVGGTQDNGTLRSPLGTSATLMFGGDGGFSAIDPTDDHYCYGEHVNLQIHRSTDGCQSASYIYSGIGDAGVSANFIAPLILDPNDPNRMLAGGASLWRSNNVKATTPAWTAIRSAGTANISAIAVAPGNANVIWVAQNDGKVYKTGDGLAPSPTWTAVDDNAGVNPLPNRYPTRILIDPANSNTAYVAFGGFSDGNLQRTLDGGTGWADVTGTGVTGLPLAPIRGVARHPDSSTRLYVGTEVGIFWSADGGGTWTATNRGPANVSVDEVVFLHNTRTLLAATHGRGLWTADATLIGGPALAVSATTATVGQSIQVTVTGGPGNPSDWVALHQASAADNVFVDWKYLNGTRTAPVTGQTSATLTFTLPATAGTYNFRFFENNTYTRLATSATVTVTGVSTPTLTLSTTSASPGQLIQVTLANGPGNARDWLALHAASAIDTSWLDWKYLSGTRTAPTVGLTSAVLSFAAPSTAGSYNFRLFRDNTYTKLVTSATVTVTGPPSQPALTVSTSTASPGQLIQVTLANGPGNVRDWIGLHAAAAADTSWSDWKYLNGTRTVPGTGSTSAVLTFAAPGTPGTYNFRLFQNGGYTRLAISPTVTVSGTATPTLSLSTPTATPGQSIQVTLTNGPANLRDWIGLHAVGAAHPAWLDWKYLNGTRTVPGTGSSSAVVSFAAPSVAGSYNFRFFQNGGYTLLATSVTLTVSGPATPTLSVSTANASPGQLVQVTLAAGPGNPRDWIGLHVSTGADTALLDWKYLNGTRTVPATGIPGATISFTMPTTPGAYNFRFFQNGGYTRLATSPTVNVQ